MSVLNVLQLNTFISNETTVNNRG